MTVMKKISFLLAPLLFFTLVLGFVSTPTVSFAQINECTDKEDNDGDNKIDRTGRTFVRMAASLVFPPDPECKDASARCENGSTATDCKAPLGDPVPNPGTRDPLGDTVKNPNSSDGAGNFPTTEFPLLIRLKNPLKVDTIEEAISLFMDAVVKIAIPFIVVFFIWAGLKFILAQGNATKLEEAKKMFWYTVIGTLLILGAWAITDAIVGTINSISS